MNNITSILNLIKDRRSIRKYKTDEVPDSLIRKMIDAARLAPSASNRQPWRFYVVKDSVSKEKLRASKAVMQKFALEAPVCLVCCADMSAYSDKKTQTAIKELLQAGDAGIDMDEENVKSYWDWWNRVKGEDLIKLAFLDIGIAVEQMVLVAQAAGLGTCWMRRIDEAKIAQSLDIPKEIIVIALLTVGYPNEAPKQRPRNPLESFLLNPLTDI